jgi:hypothetical protein
VIGCIRSGHAPQPSPGPANDDPHPQTA